MKQVAVAVGLLLCLATTASACPTCKESVADDPATAATAGGFNGAIWVMLASAGVGVVTVAGALVGPSLLRESREREPS